MEPTDSTAPVIHKPYEMPSDDGTMWVSEQEYWDCYYINSDHRYEWNNGKLEKKSMADFLSFEMYRWIMQLLGDYFKENPVGRIMGLEIGFRLTLGHRVTIRKPDLAIILHTNPVKAELLDRSYKGTCDICIEFVSDSDQSQVDRDTIIKKAEYESIGVQEYYVFDRLHQHTAFYEQQPGPSGNSYQEMDQSSGIIRSAVLPGFAFRLEHLKTLPLLETLVDDPVYQSYLLKFFQESEQAKTEALEKAEVEGTAKEAERQAKEEALEKIKFERQAKEEALEKIESERQAKEVAQKREMEASAKIERMAELLRQQGIDPDSV